MASEWTASNGYPGMPNPETWFVEEAETRRVIAGGLTERQARLIAAAPELRKRYSDALRMVHNMLLAMRPSPFRDTAEEWLEAQLQDADIAAWFMAEAIAKVDPEEA